MHHVCHHIAPKMPTREQSNYGTRNTRELTNAIYKTRNISKHQNR